MYLSLFIHPLCPPLLSHTHTCRTFDRALRTLSPSLHHCLWTRYLLWAESHGGLTTVAVFRRYLAVASPSSTVVGSRLTFSCSCCLAFPSRWGTGRSSASTAGARTKKWNSRVNQSSPTSLSRTSSSGRTTMARTRSPCKYSTTRTLTARLISTVRW